MSDLFLQKTQLAKLMASENISVQHQNVATASFDVANRVLYLPIWQEMTGDLYDLLTGHEIGHALYTPKEGWHDAVVSSREDKPGYKSFISVVDDDRIEKKIQRKYPGLRPVFKRAYKVLMDRDFFGIARKNISDLPFIDRLNIFSKSQHSLDIYFSDEELELVEKVRGVETWEDVVRVSDEIYEYAKEQSTQKYFAKEDIESLEFGEDFFDDIGDDDIKADSDPSTDDGISSDSFEENEEDDDESNFNPNKISSPSLSEEEFDLTSETDENFRRNSMSLVNEKCKPYIYVSIPTPNLNNIVTTHSRVHELLENFFKETYNIKGINGFCYTDSIKMLNEFKNKNERYISLLAKEFEMRKAAKSFAKRKISDTGELDINRLHQYQIDDNIFRKIMSIPKGKNHGLVLLLDRSGSMADNMAGSIEQIIVLTMFCRKVNIPFEVYGFGDSLMGKYLDCNIERTGPEGAKARTKATKCFSRNTDELHANIVFLRQYLSSTMSNSVFNKAMRNMIFLAKIYSQKYGCTRPHSEHLSNTPLHQAMIAVAEIMKDFKKKNHLDITNLVVVHDGDADTVNSMVSPFTDMEGIKRFSTKLFDPKTQNVYLVDNKNKYQAKVNCDPKLYRWNQVGITTEAIFKWFTAVTGSKIFGFYIVPESRSRIKESFNHHYFFSPTENFQKKFSCDWSGQKLKLTEMVHKLNQDKFVISHNPGYHYFFFVSSGKQLEIKEDSLEVNGKATPSKLRNAFIKFNLNKAVNRVLITKFIQGIAV